MNDEIESYWWRGHRDGFSGKRCMSVHIGFDQQSAYLKGFGQGRNDREVLDSLLEKENLKDSPHGFEQLYRRMLLSYADSQKG